MIKVQIIRFKFQYDNTLRFIEVVTTEKISNLNSNMIIL